MRQAIVALLLIASAAGWTGCSSPTAAASTPFALAPAWRTLFTAQDGVTGLALDGKGHLYLTELDADRIAEYSLGGAMVRQWGKSGSLPGQLSQPAKLAFDAVGDVYVTEVGNNRIQEFSAEGEPLATLGVSGTGPGQLNFPVGIAIDRQGDILVANTFNNRIDKLSANGKVLAEWTVMASSPSRLVEPYDVALDSGGNVLMSDLAGQSVAKVSPTGRLIAHWGRLGREPGNFADPRGLVVDKADNVYVDDTGNNRIEEFSPAGKFLGQWKGPSEAFDAHTDIATDAFGNVYASSEDRVMTACLTDACGDRAATQRYVELVNGFWSDHVTATSGAQTVCIGADVGTSTLNPALCKERGTAMLEVQQRFADALAATVAPARFANADGAIRDAMTLTLADLQAMVAAATAGNPQAMRQSGLKYVSDMQPMLAAFDQISPGVQHV